MPPIPGGTPGRRTLNQSIRTPVRINPNASQAEMNDDEAERIRRRTTQHNEDDQSMSEQTAGIKSVMQMFLQNKMTKENAWTVDVIDHFANLVAKHHKSMDNFQIAGTTLEASAKVYCLRVDSLHEDTLRMASNLSRQTARQLGAHRDDNDDDDMERSNVDGAENNANNANVPKKKEKRKKRVSSVITNNPASLNAKLETVPFTDPFFAKLNTIVGDINSSNRLMQHMVGTKDGALQIRMDRPFWDASPAKPVIHDENENYVNREIVSVKTNDINESHALHHNLKGYIISDKPAESDPEDEAPVGLNSVHSSFHDRSLNGPGVVFDPNAEVEPIDTDNNFMVDYGNNDDDFQEQLDQEDHRAVMGCRGLRREIQVIEDMRPVDATSSSLEYSYRPLDNIAQFWAGPSYWKIRRTTNVTATHNTAKPAGAKKRAVRKKKKDVNLTADIAFSHDQDGFTKRDPSRPIKNITYSRNHLNRSWNNKRLKLPINRHLEQNMFDKFIAGRQFRPSNKEPAVQPELQVETYNYDNEADQEYCRNVNIETDAETEPDNVDYDNLNNSDERMISPTDLQPPMNQTVDFIGTEFAGAPEKVERLAIPYSKRAKPVDMKQLKTQCWNVISEVSRSRPTTPFDMNAHDAQQIEFQQVYDLLPRVLTKSMAENISTGLAFYSVLHLANERGIQLIQHEDLEGLTIVMPNA